MAKVKLTAAQERKIEKAVQDLNDVRRQLQEKNPGHNIQWYLEDSNNLNLMEDDPHDYRCRPQQQRVIKLFTLDNASGGGW